MNNPQDPGPTLGEVRLADVVRRYDPLPPSTPDEDRAMDLADRLNRGRAEIIKSLPVADSKPTNPKDGIGATKLPLHLVSPIVKAYQSLAHFLGNVKYGAWNWRAGGARASVYVAALHRHVDAWWEGEENDPADGTPHLANALACIGILIDAKHAQQLVDDRPPSNSEGLAKVRAELESVMWRILAQHGSKKPRHWTIHDTAYVKQEEVKEAPPVAPPEGCWVPHEFTVRPVGADVAVEVMLRSGGRRKARAGDFDWAVSGLGGIAAYRLVSP